jgi:phosphate acetyltransferase
VARNLYVTAMEPQSGKSLVALGVMELLSGRVERLGFFRPIVPSADGTDAQIELVRRRFQLGAEAREAYALTQDEASAMGDYEGLRTRVVEAYKALERECDFVVCEGTDFTGAAPALDFGLNADLANELGAPVLVVVRAGSPANTASSVRIARDSLHHKDCTLFGVVVNRIAAGDVREVTEALAAEEGVDPLYLIPEDPALACATVGETADALGATVLTGTPEALQREVRDVRVGAMSVEHFVENLVDGALVIVPGDRPDILVATLASTVSPTIPAVSGVVLTGGYELGGTARGLLDGAPFAVLETPHLTHEVAAAVQTVKPLLRAEDERRIARALGLFEANVDTAALERQFAIERQPRVTPIMFEYELIERARAATSHIVLPEGDDDRILTAADILIRRGVAHLTILGEPDRVKAQAAALGADLEGVEIVDPLASALRDDYAAGFFELRKHKGMTEEAAADAMTDPTYFATMMVQSGTADGMVSGAAHTTADTIRPAFQIIGSREGVSVVSSVFLMCLSDRVLVYGDCAVNPKPDPEQLADIAISSSQTAAEFGIEPRIAMLSYSTGASGKGEDVDAVRRATEAVRERRPDLKVEGPIQYDAAVDASVAKLKLPESDVAGHATVFVFPDLETGNVAYKAVQRSANAVAIGPVLQGLRKPVNDLSRGCTVPDIVNTVAITAIQAQGDS